MTPDTCHVTCDTWHVTHEKYIFLNFFSFFLIFFVWFLSVLVSVQLSAHINRFSVSLVRRHGKCHERAKFQSIEWKKSDAHFQWVSLLWARLIHFSWFFAPTDNIAWVIIAQRCHQFSLHRGVTCQTVLKILNRIYLTKVLKVVMIRFNSLNIIIAD